MEMFQIRYVLAASRTLNFTKAAAQCNVSQPALTKAIKSIEARLGAPLFYREGRRVMLSAFGRSVLPHLQHIADAAETTQLLAQNFRLLHGVPIRLGVLSTVGHGRFARFMARFHADNPDTELAVIEASLPDLRQQLDDGGLDLAVINPLEGPAEGLRILALYDERYVVILPPDHRLAARNTIRLADLSGEAYVDRLSCEMREMVMAVCDQRDITLYARFRSAREDWVQAMVMARIGFAFMPEHAITHPDLLRRTLIEPAVSRTIALASVPGRPHNPATAAFVRAAQSHDWNL